jgi:hypothetical protein
MGNEEKLTTLKREVKSDRILKSPASSYVRGSPADNAAVRDDKDHALMDRAWLDFWLLLTTRLLGRYLRRGGESRRVQRRGTWLR